MLSAIISEMFDRLNHNTNQLYQVGLVKTKIELREPITVECFILQFFKRMLVLLQFRRKIFVTLQV